MLLNATKAFDSLEWSFLFGLLQRIGLSPRFLRLIRLLYTQPVAWVCVNGEVSETFGVERGTRQGRTLSPLLYAIAMEPLATRLRQHYVALELGYSSRGLIVLMYANDMTVYVKLPKDNLAPVLQEFIRFGGWQGSKLTGPSLYFFHSQLLRTGSRQHSCSEGLTP